MGALSNEQVKLFAAEVFRLEKARGGDGAGSGENA
jgi:hypothetical protein